jgi:hypothetical protein
LSANLLKNLLYLYDAKVLLNAGFFELIVNFVFIFGRQKKAVSLGGKGIRSPKPIDPQEATPKFGVLPHPS